MKTKSVTWTLAFGIALIVVVIAAGVLTHSNRLLARSDQWQPANADQSSTNQPGQTALVREYLEGMQKLRNSVMTLEARAQLQAEMAQKRAQLRDLRRRTRLARGILPFGPPPSGAKRTATANGDGQKLQSAQRCEACKAIMGQVADLANTKFIQDVQAAYEEVCLNAQKAALYYNVCEDMYDDMYAMTDDYMSDASKVCGQAKFCNYP